MFSFFFFFFFRFVSKQFVAVVSLLYRNREFRLNQNKQKTSPPPQTESIFGNFSENLGLFRFVTKQICLFQLFRYRFKTPKQTAIFSFWFHETNRNKRETDLVSVCFGLFGFEPKFIFVCFKDTLHQDHLYLTSDKQTIFSPKEKLRCFSDAQCTL